MKRRRRRSTSSSTFILRVPATWLRKPSSLYCGTNSMPDLPSFSDCVTSAALLPSEETMPKPVTTTRFMSAHGRRWNGVLGQPDPHVERLVYRVAVGMYEAVSDAQHQPAQDHALEMHVVRELLDGRNDHAGELDLAHADRAPAARRLHPAEEEPQQLPHRVKAKAARHHRVALEMAGEEPEIGLHVELGHDLALAIFPAGVRDLDDPVEHQHRRQRQLRV